MGCPTNSQLSTRDRLSGTHTLLVLNLAWLPWTALLPFPTAVAAQYLGAGGEAAQTAAALCTGVLALLALTALALLVWVTGDERRHRLPPETVRATRLQFLVGVAIYAVAFAVSRVWPWRCAGPWRSTTAATICSADQTAMPPDPRRR